MKHVSTVLVAAMCLTASTAFARPDGSSAIIYQPDFRAPVLFTFGIV